MTALPLHHGRGGRRLPIGLPILLCALLLTIVTSKDGWRLFREWREAEFERRSAELQADRCTRWRQP